MGPRRNVTNIALWSVALLLVGFGSFFYLKGTASFRASSSEIHINSILQQWSTGGREQAIDEFLGINVDDPASVASLRPFEFSEQHFISLPEAERDQLQEKLSATIKELRQFVRDVEGRAKSAIAQGDRAAAVRILTSVKRLGEANTGPEVTLFMDLAGQWTVKLAERELEQLESNEHVAGTGRE